MGGGHTKGKIGMLGLENYPQSFAGRFCVKLRTVRAADTLAKNMCETCPPNCGCLVWLLIRPCLPGKPILCALLCAMNSPNFPVTIGSNCLK